MSKTLPSKALSHFNVNAGVSLLHSYERQWQAMHSTTLNCAKRAENLSKSLCSYSLDWEHRSSNVDRLCKHFVLLPDILIEIDKIAVSIGHIGASIEEVSSSLAYHEKVCKELSTAQNCQELKPKSENTNLAKR